MLYTFVRRAFIELPSFSNLAKAFCSHEKTYEVSTTCNINAILSCNTTIIPNDPTDKATDTLKIVSDRIISVNQIGKTINLSSNNEENESSDKPSVCELYIPYKSNLNLSSVGDVKVGNLYGEAIRIFSEEGNVSVGDCQSKEYSVGTRNGNINTEGVLQATIVTLHAKNKGSIFANKIKAEGLRMETVEGSLNTGSCYANESYFLTHSGKMNLNNVHKRCRIESLKEAEVNLVGFDGALSVALQKGKIDVQIQKLTRNSDITIRETGSVTLQLSPDFLEKCETFIWSQSCHVDDKIAHEEDEEKDLVTIRNKEKNAHFGLRVRCEKGSVFVQPTSWIEMIEKKVQQS